MFRVVGGSCSERVGTQVTGEIAVTYGYGYVMADERYGPVRTNVQELLVRSEFEMAGGVVSFLERASSDVFEFDVSDLATPAYFLDGLGRKIKALLLYHDDQMWTVSADDRNMVAGTPLFSTNHKIVGLACYGHGVMQGIVGCLKARHVIEGCKHEPNRTSRRRNQGSGRR